nr:uncharacterized protein LOC111515090 [Leptinotarsa decemlineata]
MWLTGVAAALFLLSIAKQCTNTEASCYFPQEFQGEFVMQGSASTGGGGIQYSTLNITENSIPIWGNCHRRIGNNFILMFNFSETLCIRCLHLKLRSTTVLQVFTSNLETISKCFTNEESAEANCPSEESVTARETAEILLFKTRDNFGTHTSKQYCPISKNYQLNYKVIINNHLNECNGFNSVMNSCPSGSTLNFMLRNCSFENYDMKFECLGQWKGLNEETFMIFTDSRYIIGSMRPKYRCAVYKEDPTSGKIQMALSSDSSCTSDLYNFTSGFETLLLTPITELPWPAEVSFGLSSFPEWMYGNWEHVKVQEDTMIYKDHTSFKTHTIKCVGVIEDSDKYLVFSRTQCDENTYTCLRAVKRSNNIMEFQVGSNTSASKDAFTLCSDENFQEDSWITQGRLDIVPGLSQGMCPINGEYTGRIPDATDLCAKLWSDCRAPELMYYQVSHCESEEIYEEREYQCLGHWRESSLLYTYAQRKDVAAGTYECFVGSIITDHEIYIKEAGEHCQRHVDPLRYGMKLTKKQPLYSCMDRSTIPKLAPGITTRRTTSRPTSTFITRRTSASQDFDSNDIPGANNDERSSSEKMTPIYSLPIILYSFYKHI